MKRILIYTLLVMPVIGIAQVALKPTVKAKPATAVVVKVDRTKAPKAGPAPKLKIGKPVSLTMANGMKIYVVQNSKLPRISASLTFDIDPFIEGDKAGTSDLAGELMMHGTDTIKKEDLDERKDFLGASIGTSGESAQVSSLSSNFNKAFDMFADVVLHPAFDKDELEKLRKQTLTGLETEKDDPNSIAKKVVASLEFGKNHPYGESQSEETVNNIKIEDIKKFYNTYWKPNVAYLVFVGDIDPMKAFGLATKYFGHWQKGEIPKSTIEIKKPTTKTFVAVVDRPASVQSIITLVNPIDLKPGAPDGIAASVMDDILGGGMSSRLFRNLREKHSFTYGAYSSVSKDKYVGTFSADASVRNEKTDSAVGEFINEFNRIRDEAVSDSELTRIKNSLNGSFARSLEKPGTIAGFALSIARYGLAPDYYETYLTRLAAVDAAAVKAAANKYIMPKNMYIVIVGNAKEIAKGLDKYGEVKYYDIEGNEIKAPSTSSKAVDPSITAQSVVDKCIAATSGTGLATLKDLEMKGIASVMGQSLDYNQKVIVKKAFSGTFSMGGMAFMKQSVNNGVYSITQQGIPKEADDKEKEELNEESYFVEELYYKEMKYNYNIKGIEAVDGKDAYAVEVTTPKGRVYTNYYDVVSGLKVKKSNVEDAGPQGKITINTYFSDYKPYNNVMVPTKMLIDQGQLKINIAITEVKANGGLTDKDFQ